MFLSVFLSILGLGFMVYVLFSLAVYALPFFIALTVGMYLHVSEAGVLIALTTGLFAGVFTLLFGQIAFAKIGSSPVKLGIGALYAAPAGLAGYHAIRGLSEIGGASETWTTVLAWIGAAIVAGTAWVRIASLTGPLEDDDRDLRQAPQANSATNES